MRLSDSSPPRGISTSTSCPVPNLSLSSSIDPSVHFGLANSRRNRGPFPAELRIPACVLPRQCSLPEFTGSQAVPHSSHPTFHHISHWRCIELVIDCHSLLQNCAYVDAHRFQKTVL